MNAEFFLSVALIATTYPLAWYVSRLLVHHVAPIRGELRVDARERQLTIDGLRGVLAVAVFCHHVILTRNYLHTGHWMSPELAFSNELGQAAVALFFMITSFLFWGRLIDCGAKLRWDKFYVSRFFRLVPLYFVAVVAIVVLVLCVTGAELQEGRRWFAKNVGQWLAFTLLSAPRINGYDQTSLITAGVTWSLRYEWLFYLALPFLGTLFTRARKGVAAAVSLLGVALLVRLMRWDPLVWERFYPFLGGIVAAYWIRNAHFKKIAQHPGFGLAGSAAVLYVVFFEKEPYSLLGLALLTLFFVAIACDNPFFKWLQGAAARWVGEVSYGVYLLHGMFLWVGTRLLLPRFTDVQTLNDWQIFGFAVSVVPWVIVVTSILNLAVERPGVSLGRRVAEFRWSRRTEDARAVGAEAVR